MPRRSERNRTTVITEADTTALRETLRNAYQAFNAYEAARLRTGGGNDTNVTLSVNAMDYHGSSREEGHAEMDALNTILVGNGNSLDEVMAFELKTVTCTEKPVCYKCSIVLGLLGFEASSPATEKIKRGMGQTEWRLPDQLKIAMNNRYGDIAGLLRHFTNVDQL